MFTAKDEATEFAVATALKNSPIIDDIAVWGTAEMAAAAGVVVASESVFANGVDELI